MTEACQPQILKEGFDFRPIAILAVIAVFLNNLDSGILNVCLPVLAKELNTTISLATWTVIGYGFTLTIFALLAGRLTRRIGFRAAYFIAVSVFTGSCILCGFSGDVITLTFFRFIQGAGAGLLYALGPLVVRSFLPAEQQGRWYGLITAAPCAALLFGQPVGGWIVTYFPWQNIFFFQVPFCLLALYYCFRFPKVPCDTSRIHPMDTQGIAALFAALFLFMLWMNQGDELGWGSAASITLLILSIVILGYFIWHEKKTEFPVIELKLFGYRPYFRQLADVAVYLGLSQGTLFLLPFLLITAFLMRPDITGTVLLIQPIVMVIVSVYGGFLTERYDPRGITLAGWVLFLLSLFGFITGAFDQNLLLLGIAMFISGVSMGLYYPAAVKLTMDYAPQAYLEDATDFFSFSRTIAQVLGVAVFETIYSEIGSGAVGPIDIPRFLGSSSQELSRVSFLSAVTFALILAIVFLIANGYGKIVGDRVIAR